MHHTSVIAAGAKSFKATLCICYAEAVHYSFCDDGAGRVRSAEKQDIEGLINHSFISLWSWSAKLYFGVLYISDLEECRICYVFCFS